jgi:DNA-binding response OmpR family regulator
MYTEVGRDERVRGFVRSTELLASLSWDTARPEDNHIKQLVRRVRQALARASMGDLIESRHGFGYRLRVRPVENPIVDP